MNDYSMVQGPEDYCKSMASHSIDDPPRDQSYEASDSRLGKKIQLSDDQNRRGQELFYNPFTSFNNPFAQSSASAQLTLDQQQADYLYAAELHSYINPHSGYYLPSGQGSSSTQFPSNQQQEDYLNVAEQGPYYNPYEGQYLPSGNTFAQGSSSTQHTFDQPQEGQGSSYGQYIPLENIFDQGSTSTQFSFHQQQTGQEPYYNPHDGRFVPSVNTFAEGSTSTQFPFNQQQTDYLNAVELQSYYNPSGNKFFLLGNTPDQDNEVAFSQFPFDQQQQGGNEVAFTQFPFDQQQQAGQESYYNPYGGDFLPLDNTFAVQDSTVANTEFTFDPFQPNLPNTPNQYLDFGILPESTSAEAYNPDNANQIGTAINQSNNSAQSSEHSHTPDTPFSPSMFISTPNQDHTPDYRTPE